MDRRQFIQQASLGTAAICLNTRDEQASADTAQNRPRAPFKVLYSNDTTNITSCVSPYHERRQPFSDDRLRATIDEAKGVDVHLLQPGLGWIPWWQSNIYSARDHYEYYQREYGIKPNSYGQYLLDGGDMIRTFVEHCGKVGVAPFISCRLNDGHHVRDLEKALQEGRPSQNISTRRPTWPTPRGRTARPCSTSSTTVSTSCPSWGHFANRRFTCCRGSRTGTGWPVSHSGIF